MQRNATVIQHWQPNTLPEELVDAAYHFINRRFREVWGIERTDITKQAIRSRGNLSLTQNGRLIGWLGIEADGELDNGCIEKGCKGVRELQQLIEYAVGLAQRPHHPPIYAMVPLERLGSALACLRAGLIVAQPIEITSRTYVGRSGRPVTVHLVKLVFPATVEPTQPSRQSVERAFTILQRTRATLSDNAQSAEPEP